MHTILQRKFGDITGIIEEYLPDSHYRWLVRRNEEYHEGKCKNRRCFQCFTDAFKSTIYKHDGTWDDLALNDEGLSADAYLQMVDVLARRAGGNKIDEVENLRKAHEFMQEPLMSIPPRFKLQCISMCNWGDEMERTRELGHHLLLAYHEGALYKMYFYQGEIIETFRHFICLPCQFGNQLPIPMTFIW